MLIPGKLLHHIVLGLLVIASALPIHLYAQQKSTTPNIVYILADDMGYGDLQCLNKDSKIQTPNMNRLAKEGVYFTDAHSNSAVCTPTRYGILTGRYAFRTRLKKGVLNGFSNSLIEPGRITVADFLKENGYQTACIGKWHLGLDWARINPGHPIRELKNEEKITVDFNDNVNYDAVVKGGPADHGFDYSYIIPASLDMAPYCYIRNGKVVQNPTAITEGKSENDGRGSMRRPGKMSPDFDFQQVLPNFVNESVAFINKQPASKAKKPFFLYLPLPSPHTPWVPTEEFKNATKIGNYGDYVAETDFMIGKVMEALEKNGLAANTIVIVTSDNGSDWKTSDIEQSGHHANYIFKGRKADIYEAGHRIPFVARWPSTIPKGIVSKQTMCTTDFFATVAAILNKSLPANVAEDSFNMLNAFKGKQSSIPIRESIIHHSLGGYFAIRKGKWKLTTALGSGGFTEPRTVQESADQPAGTLYDLDKDPGEKVNVYDKNPEIVKQLTMLLDRIQQQGYSKPRP
ncbi:sulfatase-like hydrolase/transferase [Pedobacter nyackensis]|uniref:sulfatase-like hydrolase/transferase n=1 Tax=Pedobacter nyackensis TaxID=475255 RepID=UPI00292FDA2F|nr:sulfatase-like hydrolase/transferase [Pedobacter nyackensis]